MPIITVPAAGEKGLIQDIPSQELPLNGWSYGVNVIFRDGSVMRSYGNQSAFSAPSVTPYHMEMLQTTNYKYWVHCGLSKIYVDNGTGTRNDITPATAPTGSADDIWTGGVLDGIMVLGNGKDKPVYWAGNTGTPCAVLPGWGSWSAAAVRPFRNYLVAVDVTKSGTRYPHMVKWSDAAVPGAVPASWDETDPGKSAGEQDLDGNDPLVDFVPLGDVGVLYKERSMWAMRYIGAPLIWQFQRLPGNVGALTRNCVANTPLGHVVLAQGDIVLHNGQGAQSIINERNRKWLFDNIDTTNYKRSFLATNPSKNEVWVCFPWSGQSTCSVALIWNWAHDTWGVRTISGVTGGMSGVISYTAPGQDWSDTGTWDSDTTGWSSDVSSLVGERLVMCDTSPSICIYDTGSDFDGEVVLSILERTGLSFDDPTSVKVIKGIRPRVTGTAGDTLQISVGGAMDVEGAVTWSPTFNYTIGTSYKVDAFATGRFLAIKVMSTGGNPWSIRSFDIDYDVVSAY